VLLKVLLRDVLSLRSGLAGALLFRLVEHHSVSAALISLLSLVLLEQVLEILLADCCHVGHRRGVGLLSRPSEVVGVASAKSLGLGLLHLLIYLLLVALGVAALVGLLLHFSHRIMIERLLLVLLETALVLVVLLLSLHLLLLHLHLLLE